MKSLFLALMGAVSISSAAGAAVTVHTSSFISSPVASNDFAAIACCALPTNSSYSEGGITVTDVSGVPSDVGALFTSDNVPNGLEGLYDPGNTGYFSVTRDDNSAFDSIQFSAFSGWGDGGTLYYDLRLGGVSVATGAAGSVASLAPATYGFSGATFDEVRLQVLDGGSAFDASGSDALGLNNLLIGVAPGGVPEPAAWALMILGFGGVGALLRRRAPVVV